MKLGLTRRTAADIAQDCRLRDGWLCSAEQSYCPIVHGGPVKLLNTSGTDTVTELLTALTVHSSVYCLSELRAPWGFQVDGAAVAKFHLVLEGACWLQADGVSPVRLAAGELVILSGASGTRCATSWTHRCSASI
jgi:Cupin